MAFQIRPDRADDSSAPISSAFREFSIFALPDFLSSRLFTSLLGSLWGQRAPTQNSEEPNVKSVKVDRNSRPSYLCTDAFDPAMVSPDHFSKTIKD
jgi:hypothetical protein